MRENSMKQISDFLRSDLNEMEYFFDRVGSSEQLITLKEYLNLFEKRRQLYLQLINGPLMKINYYNKWVKSIIPIKSKEELIIEEVDDNIVLLKLVQDKFRCITNLTKDPIINSFQEDLLKIYQIGMNVFADYMDTTSVSGIVSIQNFYYHTAVNFNDQRLFEINRGTMNPYPGITKSFANVCQSIESNGFILENSYVKREENNMAESSMEYYKKRLIDKIYIKKG